MSGGQSNEGHGSSSGGLPSGADAVSDGHLLAQIAKRDEGAFRQVIGDHAEVLHAITYRMVGAQAEAEDIVQEALLRLWDNAPRLAEGSTMTFIMRAWLKRVTVNLTIDRLRLAKRVSGEDVPERADETPLADTQIEQREKVGAARALIESLPDRQRAAIVLTYYDELPNSEAADVMDMNIKAFESLLHRARAALKSAFAEQNSNIGEGSQ